MGDPFRAKRVTGVQVISVDPSASPRLRGLPLTPSGSVTSTRMTSAPDKTPDRIAGMFDAIAPRYDLLNHLLSAGIDRRWRMAHGLIVVAH